MDETKTLAGFLTRLRYEDLSTEVREKAKELILDQLGVELAASTKPWSVATHDYVRSSSCAGQSTIVNYGDKVRPEGAAFANATFGRGFEMDDTYLPGNVHPGSVIIPTALALGEEHCVDGKTFLLAVVSGYEAMGRVGRALAPTCVHHGFHPTSIAGPFGAATVAGRILDFDEETMLNGLSIAGSHSAGIMEYSRSGGSVKRMHAGMAATGGIRAALLARAGMTGPPTILEGGKGTCRIFSSEYHPERLTTNLGQDYIIPKVSIKRHCSCYQIQAPIDATAMIVKEHGITHDQVEEIVMGTNVGGISTVGTIVEPTDITGMQFSARFGIAMCIVKGSNGFRDYTEETMADPRIKALARKVRLEVDPEVQATFPEKRTIKMTVKVKNGGTYQQKLEGARGTPENPIPREEVYDKFRDLASTVCARDRVEQIIKVVEDIDDLGRIATLSKLLARD